MSAERLMFRLLGELDEEIEKLREENKRLKFANTARVLREHVNQFKVGDRVDVYSGRPTFRGTIVAIDSEFPDKCFVTEYGFYSCHNDAPFHYKQLEKVKE